MSQPVQESSASHSLAPGSCPLAKPLEPPFLPLHGHPLSPSWHHLLLKSPTGLPVSSLAHSPFILTPHAQESQSDPLTRYIRPCHLLLGHLQWLPVCGRQISKVPPTCWHSFSEDEKPIV